MCSVNFKAKNLKMAKINSEFLNVSMVEPAPESPARWLVYSEDSDDSDHF